MADGNWPSTVGEWEKHLENLTMESLEKYEASLAILKEWPEFKGAFGWTRMFVLLNSIRFEIDQRKRKKLVVPERIR